MTWLAWAITGAVVGWWLDVLFFHRRGAPLLDDPGNRSLARGTFYIASAIIIVCAAGQYFSWFPAGFYELKGFLLGDQVIGLIAGVAAGWWASHFRDNILRRADGLYNALVSPQGHSSWALQSAVAIVALLLIVLAIKPDLLDHIESLKAGELEAKFSSVSTSTNDVARLALADINQDVSIFGLIDFKKNFLSGARGDALEFDHSAIKLPRMEIRNILFDYIEPAIVLLACINKNDLTDEVKQSRHLMTLALGFRNMVLREHDDGSMGIVGAADWEKLIRMLDDEIANLSAFLDERVPDDEQKKCEKYDVKETEEPGAAGSESRKPSSILTIRAFVRNWELMCSERRKDVKILTWLGSEAIAGLKGSAEEAAYKLSYIDPYITGVLAEFIGLEFGTNEKANFLTLVQDKYPTDVKFVQPGIINLYYQLTDAKVKVAKPWPLDEKIAEIDFAMRGADYMIHEARRRIRQGDDAERKRFQAIEDTYFVNKIVFANRFMEIYIQHSLAGEQISPADRIKWISYYRHAEAMLSLRTIGEKLALGEIDEYALPRADVAGFRRAMERLDTSLPAFAFDIRNSMALSTILLSEKRRKAPAQACALSKFYLIGAENVVPDFKKSFKFNAADTARLRGYLLQLQARIDVSCQ